MNVVTKLGYLLLGGLVLAAQPTWASNVDEAPIGEAVERHLPTDTEYQRWVQNPEDVETVLSDEIETRETLETGGGQARPSRSSGRWQAHIAPRLSGRLVATEKRKVTWQSRPQALQSAGFGAS